VAEPDLDVWERRISTSSRAIPYVVLAATSTVYVAVHDDTPAQAAITLGLVALTCCWMLWWFSLHPGWHERRGLMGIFFAGVLVCYAALGLRDPIFGFYSFAGYVYAGEVLRGRWMFVGTVATAVLAATVLVGVPGPTPGELGVYALVVALILTLALTFTTVGQITVAQSERRRETLARLEATMRENAGLHEQLLVQAREAGVLDERHRMAREIHDTLAQGFAGIITQLQAADRSEQWRAHVANAELLARENLTAARRSVHALRPAQLDDAALPEALAEVSGQWRRVHGVPVEVATTGDARPMHPEVEVALLRTAQEALANVAKHASASRVGLTLSYMEDLVTLDVRDDGAGFDPGRVREQGFGLIAMRQRIERLAGELAVESEPGGGTAVSASVPAIPAEVTR
jgi:signal transduction histidine kinase